MVDPDRGMTPHRLKVVESAIIRLEEVYEGAMSLWVKLKDTPHEAKAQEMTLKLMSAIDSLNSVTETKRMLAPPTPDKADP